METVEEHHVARKVGEHLLQQLDHLLADTGTQKRIKLWRILRSQREKLLQLCTILTPSFDEKVMQKDINIVREIQTELNALQECGMMVNPREYNRMWRPQASGVLKNPLGAHGFIIPKEDRLVASHSERDILTSLNTVKKPPRLVMLFLGEAVLETEVWRIKMCKRSHWEACSRVELLREPGVTLYISHEPLMNTFHEFLQRVWRVCGARRLIQLSQSALETFTKESNLVPRFMPNASELFFYEINDLILKVCLDPDDGLRCEKENVILEDTPVWTCMSTLELLENARRKRLELTRGYFLQELEDWNLIAPDEMDKVPQGLIIRVEESPAMEVLIMLASTWGQAFQEKEEGKPYIALLKVQTSGWTSPSFHNLHTKAARQKAIKFLRRGAFLAGILEGTDGKWDKVKEPEFLTNHTSVTLVKRIKEGETIVIGHFKFEVYEWGIRNISINWDSIGFSLPLNLVEAYEMILPSTSTPASKKRKTDKDVEIFQSVDALTAKFWLDVNKSLERCRFDAWDIFLSDARRCFPEFKFEPSTDPRDAKNKLITFSWDRRVGCQLLKSPIKVNPIGMVTGTMPTLKRPPQCGELLKHEFEQRRTLHHVLSGSASNAPKGVFEYGGPVEYFFKDIKGIEDFIRFIERGSLPKDIWTRGDYCISLPAEGESTPAVTLLPNEVRWEKPFIIAPALEALLKSFGIATFIAARRKWGPLIGQLPPRENHCYYVVERPPALVLFLPTAPGRRIGAVFRPGHVDCWTTFNKKAMKMGKGLSKIPHLSIDGLVGKLASDINNVQSIVTYIKSYCQLKFVQESKSRRQIIMREFPPKLKSPGFDLAMVEETDPIEYLLEFSHTDDDLVDYAFAVWDNVHLNRQALVNFLAFMDGLADTDMIEKHMADVKALLCDEEILVDWVERGPTVEKVLEKPPYTLVNFYVGRCKVTARYEAHGGISAKLDDKQINKKYTSLKELYEDMRVQVQKNIEEKKYMLEQRRQEILENMYQEQYEHAYFPGEMDAGAVPMMGEGEVEYVETEMVAEQ